MGQTGYDEKEEPLRVYLGEQGTGTIFTPVYI